MDLTDSDNSTILTTSGTKVDKASGVTMPEIESSLRAAKTWEQWRNNIKNTTNGKRQQKQIDDLFDAWSKYPY